MKNKICHITCVTFFVVMNQGCVPKIPENQKPTDKKLAIPKQFPEYNQDIYTSLKKKGKTRQETSTSNQSWNRFFKDKYLQKLIHIALNKNQELKVLEQEIYIAKNDVLDKTGEYIPKVYLGYQYEIEKVGKFTSQGANDETAEYEPGKFVPKVLHNHQLGAYMSWEIDIWKKLRNAAKSAHLQYLSNIEVRKYVVTKLVAEIASSYYELKALDKQLQIVREFIFNLKQAQTMVEAQKESARTTLLAVKRFQAEVLKNRSRFYEIKQNRIIIENKLNSLLGRFPKKIERSRGGILANIPTQFAISTPVNLLNNRPDIKRATYQLLASKLNVEVARARFYPSLSIDAGTGYEAFNGKYLFNTPQSLFYNLASKITTPLINRNAIKADYFSANSKQIQALYEYHQTFINAFQEVANQLAKINNLQRIFYLRKKQVRALAESVDISNLLFKAARVEYIESLLTKRDLLEAQIELVEINKRQMLSYIELYKALGGGWR